MIKKNVLFIPFYGMYAVARFGFKYGMLTPCFKNDVSVLFVMLGLLFQASCFSTLILLLIN